MSGVSRSQPTTGHTPTPWQIGITLYPYVHFYGPADKDGFCIAVGSCVTALGKEHDEANAAFIVDAVNSHAILKARIKELEGALKIARLMIRNEIIENAVVDTQTMQSLGNTIDAALQPKAQS